MTVTLRQIGHRFSSLTKTYFEKVGLNLNHPFPSIAEMIDAVLKGIKKGHDQKIITFQQEEYRINEEVANLLLSLFGQACMEERIAIQQILKKHRLQAGSHDEKSLM